MNKNFLVFRFGLAFVTALLFAVVLPTSALAQLTRGSVAGTVRDTTNAVVTGATVRLVDVDRNQTRDTTTNEEGFYRFGALEPGTYRVVIERSGFSTVENREVVVRTSIETTFDAELPAGGTTESVDVTAQAEGIALNKTNPTIGLNATARQAEELPLSAGRDVNQLALLSPNAVRAPGASGISVNGQRARNNNFTIDGSDNNDISITVSTAPIIPEAVQEFQVQTNPYSVEFGRNSGAQINVITKSGTNSLSGDLFEYYRGSRLNSRDNIEKQNGLRRPSRFNRNQFGFAVGGPIFLPRPGEGGDYFYDGRDKSFFFAAFQGDLLRTGAGLGPTIRIPTPAGFAALSSVPLRAASAASGSTPARAEQTAASRQAVLNSLSFLNSVYAQNPAFRSITTAMVNGVAIETALTNNGISTPNDTYYFLGRIDQKLGENDNFTARYQRNKPQDTNVISNTQFGDIFSGDQIIFDQNLALSETHVFSPRFLNEFRVSYIRRNLNFPENDPVTPTTGITGFFTIGGSANFPQSRIQNSYQFSDTLSAQLGRQSFKFGADIRYIQLFNNAAFNTKGVFAFSSLANFLNNNATSFEQALQTSSFDARQLQQFYFVQDDFRVTPNLTLNLGLRYETAGAPFGFFGATNAASLGSLVPGPVERDNNNFAPAFGFAYSPRSTGDGFFGRLVGDGNTVIRGGYRINYDLLFFNILTVNGSNFPRVVTGRQDQVFDAFPNVVPVSGAAVFNPLATFVNTPQDAKTPYGQIYSLSTQRQFGRDIVVEVGYTGSRAINLINQLQANPANLTAAQIAAVNASIASNTVASFDPATVAGSAQSRRANPAIGSRVLIATSAQSSYNAGFVSVNKNLSTSGLLRDLQFGIAYTRAKNLSNNDESLGVGAITAGSPQVPQDFNNYTAEKGLSAFDRKNRFVANYLYEIPIPGFLNGNAFLRQVFGGFQVSGVTERSSGQPFTILTGIDSNGNGAGGDRPNFNPGGTITLDPVTGNFRSFTQNNAFVVPRNPMNNSLPVANSLGNGNLGRNTFRAPGFHNTNLSVIKRFTIDERRRLSVRADFLNAFNQDNYGIPVNSLNSLNFGQNLNNFGNRSITLSGKFSF